MDFSQQLKNLARTANSSSRGQQVGSAGSSSGRQHNNGNSNSTGNYNNHNNYNTSRHHHNNQQGGSSRYHPYNNNSNHRRRHNNYNNYNGSNSSHFLTQAEEDFYLPKLIQAIPKYQPIPTLPKKGKKRHVAILFLTIDDLPFENLWRAFFDNYKNNAVHANSNNKIQNNSEETKNSNNDLKDNGDDLIMSFESSNLMVSVLCHAKFPERVRSPWLQNRLLVSNPVNQRFNKQNNNNNYHNRNNNYHNSSRHSNTRHDNTMNDDRVRYHTRRPEWGSVNITRAMIDLLEEALKIGTSRDRSTLSSSTTATSSTSASVSASVSSSTTGMNQDDRYSTARYISTSSHDQEDNSNNTIKNTIMGSTNSTTKSEKIPTVDRFIFASESCLPVVTLKEFELALFGPDDDNNDHIVTKNKMYSFNAVPRNQSLIQQDSNKERTQNDENNIGQYQPHEHYTGTIANKSWLKAYNKPNNGYARQLQWDAVKKAIPQESIYKADQWIALTRHHGWPIISLIDDAVKSVQQTNVRNDNNYGNNNNVKVSLWQCFSNVKASDEIYFPTAMALLGMFQNEDDQEKGDDSEMDKETSDSSRKEIASRRVTYCDWSENAKNPASFIINRQQDPDYKELKRRIIMARNEGCLFARKFTPGYNASLSDAINVTEWTRIIHDVTKGLLRTA